MGGMTRWKWPFSSSRIVLMFIFTTYGRDWVNENISVRLPLTTFQMAQLTSLPDERMRRNTEH